MENKAKYDNGFIESFSLEAEKLNDKLIYNSIPEWDSIGHMTLIAYLEENFEIMMETDDIVEFSSYEKGMEILGKYGVQF